MCSAERSKPMRGTIDMPIQVSKMKDRVTPSPWWKRVMWLVIIYGASVLALAVVASLFRIVMNAAGMQTH